jgi:hypothetical protein
MSMETIGLRGEALDILPRLTANPKWIFLFVCIQDASKIFMEAIK